MSMHQRSYEKELLDGNVPFADILRNMQELDSINTLLGGHAITCKGVDFFLKKNKGLDKLISIVEIGCGGGDNLFAVHRFLEKKNIPSEITGIDIKQECIDTARQQSKIKASWMCSDYHDIAWKEHKPDIIFSSLFCHHFTDEELVEQLQWLKANSKLGFFINDLQRHPLAYHSIKILTRLFSKSYLVKNDAPLSVKRGFIKKDWENILNKANISSYHLSWQWAFRYLLCVTNE